MPIQSICEVILNYTSYKCHGIQRYSFIYHIWWAVCRFSHLQREPRSPNIPLFSAMWENRSFPFATWLLVRAELMSTNPSHVLIGSSLAAVARLQMDASQPLCACEAPSKQTRWSSQPQWTACFGSLTTNSILLSFSAVLHGEFPATVSCSLFFNDTHPNMEYLNTKPNMRSKFTDPSSNTSLNILHIL